MIRLENVSKYYHNEGVVSLGLRKVSLEFQIGEFVAITGRAVPERARCSMSSAESTPMRKGKSTSTAKRLRITTKRIGSTIGKTGSPSFSRIII